ncbi:MAG: porin [Verrucomicrobiota bacterium]
MNLIKKTTLALGLLAVAGTSFAQTTATSSNGLLGQRYAEFNYTLADIDSTADYAHGTTLSANIPVIASVLDVGAAYTYSWIKSGGSAHANTLAAYANAYMALDGVKPFVGASVGHSWASLPFGSDNDWGWSIHAGAEIPVGAFVITPKISYEDDFNGRIGNSDDVWTYSVEGNYWFSPKAAVYAGVARVDLHRSNVDSWNFSAGVRFKF